MTRSRSSVCDSKPISGVGKPKFTPFHSTSIPQEKYGAHDQDAQRKALAWGEPESREYKLYRCEDNTVQLQVKNLLQYNRSTSNDNMADINVNLTCQRNSDCWKYYKGTKEMSVYDRNSGEYNIELIGSSTKHSGEYVKFLLELEWK